MVALKCGQCGHVVAERLGRPLAGILAGVRCWQCSHPAYRSAAGVA